MWESGLLLADEALSRVVSSLANFRTISSPVGVTSAPQAELPQAGWASALAGTASMPVTSTAPAFPPGIPLPAGQLRTQRLRAVAADPVVAPTKTASSEAPAAPPGKLGPAGPPRPRRLGAVATLPAATLAHPTFSSEMYGRRVRFTCLQVSSHLNGQHGTIADIRSCDGAPLFDVKLQAAVGRSARPEFLHGLRPDELVLVPRTPRRIFGLTSGPDKQQRQKQRPQPRQQRQQKSTQPQRPRPLPAPQSQPLGVPGHELPRRGPLASTDEAGS